MILVDTNILVRAAQPAHAHHRASVDALKLLRRRDQLAVATQNLYELYVVCTRPITANGLGMPASDAIQELTRVRGLFELLSESVSVYPLWEDLLVRYQVVGKRAHDAHLVSVMIDNQVGQILTLNTQDFVRYSEVVALDPFSVLGLPPIP